MKLKLLFNLIILCSIALCSCEKEELPVKAYNRGNVTTMTVDMGSNYKYQLYYSLNNNKIVSSNLKTDWDIAFASVGCRIVLNTSKSMCVYKTNSINFNTVSDTLGFSKNCKYDVPSGDIDSTAFGQISDNSFVYIIFRGYNENGTALGYLKLQITSITDNDYSIIYSDLNGANSNTATIIKNTQKNFVQYSFNKNSSVEIEPDKIDYDLIFTQYTHIFYNPFEPYLVSGVLQNCSAVRSALIVDKDFSAISISDTARVPLSKKINTIGYSWKSYNYTSSSYVIYPNMVYIIQDVKGFYYKLHFTSFYNTQGQKGSPTFEFQKI
ncbi:MAG: HmuY family protein [Bacteroidia bacterium]|nr:HmuY family protein [Bacteroidia bacterium]